MDFICDKDVRMEKTVVAFGCFDGLHLGHKTVVGKLTAASSEGLTSVLLSLDYSSRPDAGEQKVIYTEEEKAAFLEAEGPDAVVSMSFDDGLYSMDAEEFVKKIIIEKLGAEKIVAGENIRFGQGASGGIDLLDKLAGELGFDLIRCPVVEDEGREISSEWIRSELTDGDLHTANRLLGRPFTIYGEVVHGKALGRTVGMPTANLKAPENKLMPKFGVYGSLSDIDNVSVMGLTNLGRRPSVDDFSYITIETFLLDFSGDIYGERIALELHAYIRGVVKFPNLEAVKAQVDKDIQAIRTELEKVHIH